MHVRFPASLFVIVAVALVGCQPRVSAVDRQHLNHALTYFIYAQADAQLARRPNNGRVFPRTFETPARNWVIQGLREPDLVPVSREIEIHGGVGANARNDFAPGISLGGSLKTIYKENPNTPLGETLIQLFKDAQARWDQSDRLWHLGHEYRDDYELVRKDDRFKFFLAFYQDPFPDTTRD